ncbi:MAG: glycosyltransferase [Lachnospiraceae bacterium]
MKKISVIVPCFNEAKVLEVFQKAMNEVMGELTQYTFEILLVDDGSTDETYAMVRALAEVDERFQYLSFSRNFGKEAAIYAGLNAATGVTCPRFLYQSQC